MNNKKAKKGLISVIIPLFGNFDCKRVEMCIESIKSQKGIDLEIIVVEQTRNPQLIGRNDIIYQHTLPIQSKDGFYFPGKVRNRAVKIANGEFIYNNDGDILFFDENYLKKLKDLLERNLNLCLYQPQIRRLPIENFEEFRKRFDKEGLQSAISTLDFSQPYGATYDINPVRIRHFIKEKNGREEVSVATQQDHGRYLDGDNKGKEPFFYTLGVHAGGIIMRHEQFDLIGGYCERYAGWGCHDEDIQWKLKSFFDLQFIPKERKLEVLHLDHPRSYFSNNRWILNQGILKERKSSDISKVIEKDKHKYNG